MNAILPAEGLLARFAARRDALGANAPARQAAAAYLAENGLPGPRSEGFKYTNLRDIARAQFADPAAPPALPDLGAFAAHPRLVFSNGQRDAANSTLLAQPGLHVAGHLPAAADDAISAMNVLLGDGGAAITLDPGIAGGTLVLVHLSGGAQSGLASHHPAHRLALGRGAQLRLIEIFSGAQAYLSNPSLHVQLDEASRLEHVRIILDSPQAVHVGQITAQLGADAQYTLSGLTLGARLTRLDAGIVLAGHGARCVIALGQALQDTQHGDFTSVIRHDAPHTTSREVVRNVLRDSARAVFQGRIEVARAAQKTDGYQMNQALLLSPSAEIDNKPELEIFADDVKCSHGATVGALDEEQVFYLRSRGIPEEAARAMLIEAFLAGLFDELEDGELAQSLTDVIARRGLA